MSGEQLKLGVLFLGRRRPGFDMEWGRSMEERVRAALRRPEFVTFEPEEKATDGASVRRAMEKFEQQGVDAIAVLQTTMGDGRLAPTVAQLWKDPVVLWPTPENPQGEMISSCSLVGAHAWASTLRQMGHPFDLVYGAPEDDGVEQRLLEAVRLAATARRLRSVCLGIVGGQAPGFFAMSVDPFSAYRGLGVQIQTFSLLDLSDRVESFGDPEVASDVAAVKALGLPHKDTTDDDLPMASRLYLAMRSFLESDNLDGMAIRCWPEIPNRFGQWPYLGLARLAEEGRAIACEGDAEGALSAWIGKSLGMGRSYLSDWLEHDRETITLWHGGLAPVSFFAPRGEPGAPAIARHFNLRKPAVIEGALRPDMPVTIMRLWHCDGVYCLTAREGRTISPRRRLMGTNALARVERQDPGEWFEELCHAGMPHHVLVFEGRHEAQLRRFARVLQIRFL